MMIGGGEACADVARIPAQGALFGSGPSDSTLQGFDRRRRQGPQQLVGSRLLDAGRERRDPGQGNRSQGIAAFVDVDSLQAQRQVER